MPQTGSSIQYFLLLGTILIALASCTQKQGNKESEKNPLNVTIQEPVDRNWAEIKEEGVLRMITRYSSNTYFLHQGMEWGFEYELLNEFAKNHNLALEVVVMEPDENPYDMLNSGKGDVIAANYTITEVREQYVDFTRPYNLVSQVLVFSDELYEIPQNIQQLIQRGIPVAVRPNSSYYYRLQELRKNGYPIEINLVSNTKHTEALLYDVSQGAFSATVADDNIFQAADRYMDHLIRGPIIAKKDTIAWAIRKSADRLKQELNQFLAVHFRLNGENEKPESSTFLNLLRNRYFEGGRQLAQYYYTEKNPVDGGIISPFDEIFKTVADSAGLDWLMLAAIAAQESHFNPNAEGWAGAIGLMQIMPEYSQITTDTLLYNPEVNVQESARILTNHLKHYSYIDSTDRWQFVLAAYNAGQGHLADARRLVIDFNENPNEWVHTADALVKLMDRTYYKNARYGFARGIVTTQYVREIMNRYETYKTILALVKSDDETNKAAIFGFMP